MKFAEHLTAHITPEWRKQYINYEVSSVSHEYSSVFCVFFPLDFIAFPVKMQNIFFYIFRGAVVNCFRVCAMYNTVLMNGKKLKLFVNKTLLGIGT